MDELGTSRKTVETCRVSTAATESRPVFFVLGLLPTTMTDHISGPFDGDIDSEAELEAAMQHVLRSAADNGVDPRGSWVYRNGDSFPDWEVMVLELTKDSAAD